MSLIGGTERARRYAAAGIAATDAPSTSANSERATPARRKSAITPRIAPASPSAPAAGSMRMPTVYETRPDLTAGPDAPSTASESTASPSPMRPRMRIPSVYLGPEQAPQPPGDEEAGDAGKHEKGGEAGDERRHERAARALRVVRRVEPGVQQTHVALVGFVGRVEHVAGEGDHADQSFKRDVKRHAREDASRNAERGGLAHDIARKDDAHGVADHREKADQRVQAYGEPRSRDRDRAVEQPREPVEPLANLPGDATMVHAGGRLRIGVRPRFGPKIQKCVARTRAAWPEARSVDRRCARARSARSDRGTPSTSWRKRSPVPSRQGNMTRSSTCVFSPGFGYYFGFPKDDPQETCYGDQGRRPASRRQADGVHGVRFGHAVRHAAQGGERCRRRARQEDRDLRPARRVHPHLLGQARAGLRAERRGAEEE